MSKLSLINDKMRFFLGDRNGLVYRLFSYFALILILIMSLQSFAEMALIRVLLQVPTNVQNEMLALAKQADALLDHTDTQGQLDKNRLARWEQQQKSYVFVLNDELETVSGRTMHPHFKFKLRYLRQLDTVLENKVNKPVIAIPLRPGYQLVVQFSDKQHPAHFFPYYFAAIQLIITILLLVIFSFVLARHLQRPLQRLQAASHALAEGNFNIRVSNQVGESVTEFNQLARDFDHMAERIHRLVRKQKQLITDVSHELRTPLARHNLILHLLRKRCPDDVSELLDRLDHESTEMNNLVSEILEFSRLEGANLSANIAPTQLESLCQMQLMQSEAYLLPGQTLHAEVNNTTPMALADSRLCLRAIKNILENAHKYAGESATITLTVKQTAEHVEIAVADNGMAIPQQQLQRIFDPFIRLEKARDKQSGGYGLGLAIVKEAMLIMQGQAIAEINDDKGLTIRLLFPQA